MRILWVRRGCLGLCAAMLSAACNRADPASKIATDAERGVPADARMALADNEDVPARKGMAAADDKGARPVDSGVVPGDKARNDEVVADKPSQSGPDGGSKNAPKAKVAALSKAELEGLKLVREKLSTKQYRALNNEKVGVFGKEYPAKPLCPEETDIQPGSVEIYSVAGHSGFRVILCTDSLDGIPNVVTALTQDGRRQSKSVAPKRSSYRIEDPKLVSTAKALLRSI